MAGGLFPLASMSPVRVTLEDEIKDLKRELGMRKKVYPNQLLGITDPRRRAELNQQHAHQIACTEATIARLEASIPSQAKLF